MDLLLSRIFAVSCHTDLWIVLQNNQLINSPIYFFHLSKNFHAEENTRVEIRQKIMNEYSYSNIPMICHV